MLEGEAVLKIDGSPTHIFGLLPKPRRSRFHTGRPLRDAAVHDGNALKMLMICASARTRPLASPAP
jgi:hypothetical protein